jgi:hypothetical protein
MNNLLQKIMNESFTDEQGEGFNPERFAELIIKECVRICEQGTITQTTSGGAASMIEQHFGITDNPIDYPLDGKSSVELNLDKEMLYELMLMAHERDITLNQLVEDVLRFYIELETKK